VLGCCVTIFWFIGSCIVLKPVRVLARSTEFTRRHGAKVVGFESFDLKPDWCNSHHQNDTSYYLLTEDWEPRLHHHRFAHWSRQKLLMPFIVVFLEHDLIEPNS
jgi:hypothetical protein